ncbi:iron reductase [Roridomyces roridus]|uniref:Iron reductase n=1 Tax=Roridomyces roridus TaxID=1738132 RepID=A0AAD7BYN7_9AGAR|nr:iron reductase [Roridomyces roridus]
MDPVVLLETQRRANPDRAFSFPRTYAYPTRVWYFIGSFIVLLSLVHFVTRITSFARSRTPSPASPLRFPTTIVNFVRNVAFRVIIHFGRSYRLNLTEFFLACAYIALLFTWGFINTTSIAGVHWSPSYYANRMAIIAATQLPLLVVLGMKDNILAYLTGISFDKLNILHRIVARVICAVLWAHASGHIIENGREGNLEDLQETWFRCGIMALSSLTLLCIFSVKPLRSRGYELFLVVHFSLGAIALGGAYYHADANGLGYYILPSLLLFCADRCLRLIRIFLINGGLATLLRTKASKSFRAKIEVISPQFLRVSLQRPSFLKWAPGQLAYLSIPSVSALPWEGHPFTIASIDSGIFLTRDESSDKGSVEMVESNKIVFLIRVHDGFTKRLLHAASSSSTEGFRAYIDGPYSSPPSVKGFETVLLISGGSGVSFTLPLLLDLIKSAHLGTNVRCQRIVFIWAIRHAEHIRAISGDLSKALDGVPDSLLLDIRIHITAGIADSASDAEKSDGSTSDLKLLDSPAVRILSGRPDIAEIVHSQVGSTSCAMSVNVCGTTEMADHARWALRAAGSGPSINLHVEAFGL